MHLTLRLEGEDKPREHDVWATRTEDTVELEVDGERYEAHVARHDDGTATVELDGATYAVEIPDERTATIDGRRLGFEITTFAPGGAPGEHETIVQAEGAVYPPMPGKLVEIHVAEGDEVSLGDDLGVLEAMKMQSTITAPREGTVLRIHADAGEAVEAKDLLFEIGDPDDG